MARQSCLMIFNAFNDIVQHNLCFPSARLLSAHRAFEVIPLKKTGSRHTLQQHFDYIPAWYVSANAIPSPAMKKNAHMSSCCAPTPCARATQNSKLDHTRICCPTAATYSAKHEKHISPTVEITLSDKQPHKWITELFAKSHGLRLLKKSS